MQSQWTLESSEWCFHPSQFESHDSFDPGYCTTLYHQSILSWPRIFVDPPKKRTLGPKYGLELKYCPCFSDQKPDFVEEDLHQSEIIMDNT